MRRRHTWKENAISAVIGLVIGCLLGAMHLNSAATTSSRAAVSSLSEPGPMLLTCSFIEPIPAEIAPIPEPDPDPAPVYEPEPYNDPDIPDEIEAAAEAAAEVYGFDPEFLEAVAFYESTYNTKAENGGCWGLMQVAPRWHYDRMERLGYTKEQLWEAGPNMMVAADYLRELYDRHGDLNWALMYYNGDSRANDYLKGQAKASGYARQCQELADELRIKHGKL